MEAFSLKKCPVTVALVVLNAAVYLFASFTGSTQDTGHMLSLGAAYGPYILEGEWYRLITSMFLHFGVTHLANNMLVLLVLGLRIEPILGSFRMLFVYLMGGLGGNLLSLAWAGIRQPVPICSMVPAASGYAVCAGASGATFALTGAMLFLTIRGKGRAADLTVRQAVIMAALSLYLGFASGGVDNAAHFGGLVCGFVLTALVCLLPGRK